MRVETAETDVSFGDFARALMRRKRMIFISTGAAAALTAAIVFILPVRYTSEAVILPPQPEQSQASMMNALSGAVNLGLLANSGVGGMFRNPGDLYVGLLKSRVIADALIGKFDLQRRYDKETMVDTRKRLARRTEISVGKDLLIHIRVEDGDRAVASAMANAYVEELYKQNSRLALSSAAQRRLFFEQQVNSEKEELVKAEVAFKGEQQASGLIYPSGQSALLLRSIAELHAQISEQELEAQSARLYAGPQNQEVRQIEEGISGMRAQLQKLEGSAGGGNGDLMVPARKIPEAGLDYLRKMRDVQYHEALFGLLSKQYEAARIDEARQAPVVQVVDRAIPTDKKSWPPRALFIALAAALAALISCAVAARLGRLEGGMHARR